jgi:transposase
VEHYAGLDVSLELTSVCLVDASGQVVREAKVESTPAALIHFLRSQDLSIGRVALEAGPLSQWLHAGLMAAGFEAVLLETRHVKAALSAMTVKTDRRDARGIAQLLRLGWFRPVHAKSTSAQEVRALLTARKLIQGKCLDIESGIRGVLRGFGLKVGPVSKGRFEARVVELIGGHAMLEAVIGSMLKARSALHAEFARLHRTMLGLVRADPVCRQLMSVPGVGAVVAITFKSGVDDPARFRRSRDVGAHFGLTPRKYQSGELDVTGSISKVGDKIVRTALYEAAGTMLTRTVRVSGLKSWALGVARRRGGRKARVALARKLGVILHRMWVDGTTFRWSNEPAAMTA